MIYDYSLSRTDVGITVIDTAPRWRTIHSLGVWKRAIGGGLQLFRDIYRLLSVVHKKKIKVVHLTTSGGLAALRDLLISLLLGATRVRLVYHIRFGRIPDISKAGTLEWKIMAAVMRRADVVIAIDAATLEAIQTHAADVRAVLVPNCVDVQCLQSSFPCTGDQNTIVFLGWVIPGKGIGELIDAWTSINTRGWTLQIVGPVEEGYHQELLYRSGYADIEFLGELPHREAMSMVAQCGIFTLPSHSEGFPNVIAEAMTLGRPIVATRVGAIPEMLAGGCGLLVEKQNTVDLASAIDRLLDDRSLRDDLGRRAHRKAVDHYALDVVFREYSRIWKMVGN